MFDSHCHLNFSRFKKNIEEVIIKAREAGVGLIVVPGTDLRTSEKAIKIANEHEGVYAAVGIHPHHVYEFKGVENSNVDHLISELEKIVKEKKVVAIGEIGMDRHVYESTKYSDYSVDEKFIELQKILFREQVRLAIKYKKSLIIHNREAKKDLLPILHEEWQTYLEGRAVFHCCEPDEEILDFAKAHKMYIGVDGDITYFIEKQIFIKRIPLEMLVLETDSPFLLPEPLRSKKLFPNKPENISLISEFIAGILGISVENLRMVTTENAKKLFQIS